VPAKKDLSKEGAGADRKEHRQARSRQNSSRAGTWSEARLARTPLTASQ